MYAEAKMELNEIDDSVLEAINRVRARAYGVEVSATGNIRPSPNGSRPSCARSFGRNVVWS